MQGMYNEAREIFDDMQKAGCNPNVVTYTSLSLAYSNAGLLLHTLNPKSFACFEMNENACDIVVPSVTIFSVSFIL